MIIAIVMLGILGLVSIISTTKESRAAARRKLSRYNPIFGAIAFALWAFILWPRR